MAQRVWWSLEWSAFNNASAVQARAEWPLLASLYCRQLHGPSAWADLSSLARQGVAWRLSRRYVWLSGTQPLSLHQSNDHVELATTEQQCRTSPPWDERPVCKETERVDTGITLFCVIEEGHHRA